MYHARDPIVCVHRGKHAREPNYLKEDAIAMLVRENAMAKIAGAGA